MADRQEIAAQEAFIRGEEDSAAIDAEPYEGTVAVHVNADSDDMAPAASVYLSPVDAAVFAERVRCAVDRATENPEYTP